MCIAMRLNPFGSFAAIMRMNTLFQIFGYSDVESVLQSAKDIYEVHADRISSSDPA